VHNPEIFRQIQRSRDLITAVDRATAGDLELQSHWARYLCVLAAGIFENALPAIYGAYIRTRSAPNVAAFASAALASIRNPKSERFLEIASCFDSTWPYDLMTYLDTNGHRDAIDSIIANRNLIAHGKISGITLSRFKDYFSKAIEVLEFIEEQCKS
jgi:hypothetical protein